MTLDEAYRHIKASYIHHSQERNAVLLPQAELIAMECIEKCKQADVQPVKRGKWIYYKNNGIWDIHKCTVCNTPFELPMDVVPSSVFCYCPHCGADMRGEDDA